MTQALRAEPRLAQDAALPPYLLASLRRLRMEAALSVADQEHFPEEQRAQLRAALAEAIEAERATRDGQPDAALPLGQLAQRLGLRPIDERVLLAAVALEVDPLFAVTVAGLGGEEPRYGLSARLLVQVLRLPGDDAVALRLDGSHPLVESGLLETPSLTGFAALCETLRPYRASARVISFLTGQDTLDPLLLRVGGRVSLPERVELEPVAAAVERVSRVLASGEDVIVCLEGVDGVGRRTVAALAARTQDRTVVALDAARLSHERARMHAELRALRRECWLGAAVPLVARLDALARRDRGDEALAEVAEMLEAPGAVRGPAIVTLAPGADLPELRRRVLRVRVDPPGPPARARMWHQALGPMLGHGALDPALDAALRPYVLTPAGIQRAAQNARLLAQGRALLADDIRAGVAAEIQERLAGLATRVTVTQRWDDLVLPQDTLDDVLAFASRAANAALVYDDWGFRDKLGRGLGLAALFSGPPGTGKTMVAGLIAQSLGLDLYQVDLSQVVSKWVGETEKQLGKIFDAAAMGHALILFDEADALFARRTEVKSSNDRYANLEVNYLLQRIELFGGVAILTTNLDSSVDPAFKRRLAAEVRFYPPDQSERQRLWQTLLPARAPLDDSLDFGELAAEYPEMCGGHIRNAVLRAAFLAAAELREARGSGRISQALLHRAARVEYRAMGKVL